MKLLFYFLLYHKEILFIMLYVPIKYICIAQIGYMLDICNFYMQKKKEIVKRFTMEYNGYRVLCLQANLKCVRRIYTLG